jgi:hypothetical protein
MGSMRSRFTGAGAGVEIGTSADESTFARVSAITRTWYHS